MAEHIWKCLSSSSIFCPSSLWTNTINWSYTHENSMYYMKKKKKKKKTKKCVFIKNILLLFLFGKRSIWERREYLETGKHWNNKMQFRRIRHWRGALPGQITPSPGQYFSDSGLRERTGSCVPRSSLDSTAAFRSDYAKASNSFTDFVISPFVASLRSPKTPLSFSW